ncbi:MAG TPA: hypothetical protein GXX75_13605 [Clostridiales bacterium]|nr:hypothetical protein [Clostridiales bacterium]
MSKFIRIISSDVEDEKYNVIMVLPQIGIETKAIIRAVTDCSAPFLYQVLSRNSAVYFKTLAEARKYCSRRGWL